MNVFPLRFLTYKHEIVILIQHVTQTHQTTWVVVARMSSRYQIRPPLYRRTIYAPFFPVPFDFFFSTNPDLAFRDHVDEPFDVQRHRVKALKGEL